MAIFYLSFFNLMAVGIDVSIPVTLLTIIIITIFEVPGFIMLIIFYMFIL